MHRITHYLSPPHFPNFSTIHQIHTNSLQPQNQILYNYLINNFNFPKPRALKWSNIFQKTQTLEKPESLIKYFKSLGFTDTQIISSATKLPHILFVHIARTLKPKIDFLQELGITGPKLCNLISNNPSVLAYSLNKQLKPSIEIVRNILSKHSDKDVNHNLLLVLKRGPFFGLNHKHLLANVQYLESCGVEGSQLAKLLVNKPRLMVFTKSCLRGNISNVLDLGFTSDSGMFVRGLIAVSSVSNETFLKKWKLFKSFGVADTEAMEMVKSFPHILVMSEDKLRFGFRFFLETIGLKKSALIQSTSCLSYDMRNRVVPRYRVVNLMESKGILKKEIKITSYLKMTEKKFMEKYITRFPDHAEDLWDAYKGHLIETSN